MKRSVLAILAFCLSVGSGIAREIGVCVLNDQRAPVSDQTIDTLIAHASIEYEAHVGISLVESERRAFPLDVFLSDSEQAKAIEAACSGAEGEIAIIFSNQMVKAADWYAALGVAQESRPKGYLLGLGNPSGYVMVMSIPYGLRSRDASGNPKVFSTIKHELGHLFYPGHLEDRRSFLYRHGSGFNLWTAETAELILQNSHTTWSLAFEPSGALADESLELSGNR